MSCILDIAVSHRQAQSRPRHRFSFLVPMATKENMLKAASAHLKMAFHSTARSNHNSPPTELIISTHAHTHTLQIIKK